MNGSPRFRQPRGSREKGMALFLAILLLLVITVMGVALMFTASIEQTLAGTETKISKIFYAADSGIEYATGMLNSAPVYIGGPMPVGVSTHYPGGGAPDMQVTVAPPVLLGYSILPGDQIQSEGKGYGTSQVVENVYALTSTANSTTIQASKTIDADVGVYPKLLAIPE
jgi:type IV pilus assembly PilX-like protein